MKIISNQEFGGERPLYCEHDLRLEGVTILAGESSLKETRNIEAVHCTFEGKYPLWRCFGSKITDCVFREGARSGIWYSEDMEMSNTLIEAPKEFRSMRGVRLRDVTFNRAHETLWDCSQIDIKNVHADEGDYLAMHSHDIRVDGLTLNGNYAFQYCRDIEIRNSVLNSKDALWETENVTVYDSTIIGEYLAWHSKNVRFVRCHFGGTQLLCYAEGLVLEDCTFDPDADLLFEYSDVQATINGPVTSIKNPRHGSVLADSIGEVILDANIMAPGDCQISTRG